jgi:glucose-1-phosphate cytidylyltransferase
MKVVILCGGKGTRLREETEFRPKPMVPIGQLPILWHIMKYYAHFGHREFVLCLGYKGEVIKEFFRNYLWNLCDVTVQLNPLSKPVFHGHEAVDDWKITLAETGMDTLTGKRVAMIRPYIEPGEPFMLTYGDGLSNIDVNALLEGHARSGKICTLSAVHPAGRFGSLTIDEDGAIHSFDEKPQLEKTHVNGGFMVCEHAMFDYLEPHGNVMLEREPMTALVQAGQLNSFRHEGWWQPMDTYQEAQYLNDLWNKRQAPWKVWST